MRDLIKIAIFTLLTDSSFATVVDGNHFYEGFQYAERGDQTAQAYLNGIVAGFYDSNEKDLNPCVGESVRMSQLRDAVGIFYSRNPSQRDLPLRDTFVEIIKTEWGCK